MMNNIKYKLSRPPEHLLQEADALISQLKQQLAANEEYIKELETLTSTHKLVAKIFSLKYIIRQQRIAHKKLKREYRALEEVSNNEGALYHKLTKEIELLKMTRDNLLYKLNGRKN